MQSLQICKTIAFTSGKGGTGKTTSSLNLATGLNKNGKHVLLIDNDPQGNLTAAMGFTPAEQRRTLKNLLLSIIDYPEDLEEHLKRTILHTGHGIDLIAANGRLSDSAARLQVMQLSQYSSVRGDNRNCEQIMDLLLTPLRRRYDYIIIDCGLKFELLTINALAASDYCIIPVQAHYLASEGIPDILDMVRTVQNHWNPDLKIGGLLLTMYQSRPNLCRNVLESVTELYSSTCHVFARPIEYSVKVAECPTMGLSILDYDPRNPATASYLSLTQEVLRFGEA